MCVRPCLSLQWYGDFGFALIWIQLHGLRRFRSNSWFFKTRVWSIIWFINFGFTCFMRNMVIRFVYLLSFLGLCLVTENLRRRRDSSHSIQRKTRITKKEGSISWDPTVEFTFHINITLGNFKQFLIHMKCVTARQSRIARETTQCVADAARWIITDFPFWIKTCKLEKKVAKM
jgi:hypothetical protein